MGAQSLALQFEFSARALGLNVDGISDEEAAARPPGGTNSVNWVVGHVVAYRQRVLSLLGAEPTWPDERIDLYNRGTSGDLPAEATLPLSRLTEELRATTAVIVERLNRLSPDALAAPSSTNPRSTLEQQLGFLAFHESYHVGQVGVLRRLIGKPGAIR
jgi:uncharacterized damage-inducible protein DinB